MQQVIGIRTGPEPINFLEISGYGVFLLTEVPLHIRCKIEPIMDKVYNERKQKYKDVPSGRELVWIFICRENGKEVAVTKAMRDYIPLEKLEDMVIEYKEIDEDEEV